MPYFHSKRASYFINCYLIEACYLIVSFPVNVLVTPQKTELKERWSQIKRGLGLAANIQTTFNETSSLGPGCSNVG